MYTQEASEVTWVTNFLFIYCPFPHHGTDMTEKKVRLLKISLEHKKKNWKNRWNIFSTTFFFGFWWFLTSNMDERWYHIKTFSSMVHSRKMHTFWDTGFFHPLTRLSVCHVGGPLPTKEQHKFVPIFFFYYKNIKHCSQSSETCYKLIFSNFLFFWVCLSMIGTNPIYFCSYVRMNIWNNSSHKTCTYID